MNQTADVSTTVTRVARDSHGRLVAFLAARSGDLAAAQDAMADAFRAALETWPETGIPDRPESWLLTVAKRQLLQQKRHARVEEDAAPELVRAAEQAEEIAASDEVFPDERLKLLFVCAHPAIDPSMHTAFMLQAVLGLSAERIAPAFLLKPSTMGQRLSRAKAKIREAGIAYEVPAPPALAERLDAVLEAIYAAFGTDWDGAPAAVEGDSRLLWEEALELTRLLDHLLPDQPEVLGLLALMLHCQARRAARYRADGSFVPLAEQDTTQWSRADIAQADALLARAASLNRPGRYQLEAAIQSVHARRASSGVTDWAVLTVLYQGLAAAAPTLGALLGRVAAVTAAEGQVRGQALFDAIPADQAEGHQPYWVLKAELAKLRGDAGAAREAMQRALELTSDPALRAHLAARV